MIIATKHDLEAYLDDESTHDAALAHLQCLIDERYNYGPGGTWGIVEPNGLTRLGLTAAEAVELGAVDRVVDEPVQVIDLAAQQAIAASHIDSMAESLCNQVITPGSAQMARYQRKEGQARAFRVAVVPDDPDALAAFKLQYAAIYGEVGITADTPQAVAEVIIAMADAWWAYGDEVEAARLAGKRSVEAAGDLAGIAAAEAAVVWPDVPA